MKNKYIILVLLITAFSTCTKEDLSLDPEGRELDVTFYQTESQLKEAMLAAYDPLQDVVWGGNYFMWGSIASDDAIGGGADATDQKTYQMADRFTLIAYEDKEDDLFQFWRARFRMVYRSNAILKFADDETIFGKTAIAHANFIKGLAYFQLTTLFGGLPIIDKLANPEDKFSRASQSDTWKAIEGYLQKAVEGLPERAGGVDPEGLATKASAQALLGKVYVYQEKYAEAITILEQVAQNPEYSLEPNFADIFWPANKHGRESLFEINFTPTDGGTIWDQYNNGNAVLTLCGIRTGEVGMGTPETVTFLWGWGMNQPTPKLAQAFDAMGDKIRKNNSIISNDSVLQVSPTTVFQNSLTGYWDIKHVRRRGFFTSATQVNAPIILQRLADVYLLLAESYAKTSDETNALKYLNLVRKRAGLADATGGADLLTRIKKERQLELCLEGDRYFDLVRWGDAAAELTGEEYDAGGLNYTTGTPGVSTNGLFPIPHKEMDAIGDDPDFPQNPGY
ncbi:MAG: RagB/SusD family nutrient uptake outer membrane protein [Bacteroidales bacterium]|nr:RagB/SusD family nutrient uptake outer membrane protein [Bacteroidales bacterium]